MSYMRSIVKSRDMTEFFMNGSELFCAMSANGITKSHRLTAPLF